MSKRGQKRKEVENENKDGISVVEKKVKTFQSTWLIEEIAVQLPVQDLRSLILTYAVDLAVLIQQVCWGLEHPDQLDVEWYLRCLYRTVSVLNNKQWVHVLCYTCIQTPTTSMETTKQIFQRYARQSEWQLNTQQRPLALEALQSKQYDKFEFLQQPGVLSKDGFSWYTPGAASPLIRYQKSIYHLCHLIHRSQFSRLSLQTLMQDAHLDRSTLLHHLLLPDKPQESLDLLFPGVGNNGLDFTPTEIFTHLRVLTSHWTGEHKRWFQWLTSIRGPGLDVQRLYRWLKQMVSKWFKINHIDFEALEWLISVVRNQRRVRKLVRELIDRTAGRWLPNLSMEEVKRMVDPKGLVRMRLIPHTRRCLLLHFIHSATNLEEWSFGCDPKGPLAFTADELREVGVLGRCMEHQSEQRVSTLRYLFDPEGPIRFGFNDLLMPSVPGSSQTLLRSSTGVYRQFFCERFQITFHDDGWTFSRPLSSEDIDPKTGEPFLFRDTPLKTMDQDEYDSDQTDENNDSETDGDSSSDDSE